MNIIHLLLLCVYELYIQTMSNNVSFTFNLQFYEGGNTIYFQFVCDEIFLFNSLQHNNLTNPNK